MSPETQLKGVLKAIDSPRTPPHLKKALGRRAVELKAELKRNASRRRGLLGRLGFLQMGGVQTIVRATWRIANLTTRDLDGQDPALHIGRSERCPVRIQSVGLGRSRRGETPPGGREAAPLRSEAEQPLYL